MRLLLCLLCLSDTIAFLVSHHENNHRVLTAKFSSIVDPVETGKYTCTINKPIPKRSWFRRSQNNETLEFDYHANQRIIEGESSDQMRAILLIHPIGVGIGRWYYNRLLAELQQKGRGKQRTLILAPDLLACGSASQPKGFERKLPLFTVKDWSQQLLQLMEQAEEQNSGRIDWCVVSNGGCVPIALETGALYLEKSNTGNLTNMVLSATPRLPSLLREPPSPEKVQKSYRFLSGVAGKLFWWYSLRNNGTFIRKFSERSLMADPANLGEDWTPQCVATAKIPNSKYSTFGFLAGALQHDCRPAFHALRDRIEIDVIRTRPKKGTKSARSWFWDRKRKLKPKTQDEETLSEFLKRNGNGGKEVVVGGRTCPAHEDVAGYVDALMSFFDEQ